MDIRLDGRTMLFQNGRLFMTRSRQDKVRQRLQIRLRTLKGTWFLNILYGIDWFNDVFGDGISKTTVDALLQSEILKDKYVEAITAFTSGINPITGMYSCDFAVRVKGLDKSVEVKLLTNQDGLLLVDSTGFAVSV